MFMNVRNVYVYCVWIWKEILEKECLDLVIGMWLVMYVVCFFFNYLIVIILEL